MTGSLVLLVCAGLFIRNLNATHAVDPGFGYQPAAMLTLGMPDQRYDEEAARTFQRGLFERLKQLPGVDAVGLTTNLHLNKLNTRTVGFQIDGVENPPDRDGHSADWAIVDAGFFDVVGLRIVQGRNFQETDVEDGPEVIIINEAFAERFWSGQDPIGKRLRRSGNDWQVVGVATTAKIRALNEAPRPFVYRPYSQAFNAFITVLASTQVDDEGTAREMLAVARELDPELWLWEVKTMRRHLDILLVPARLSALLLSVFAALALTIASIGLYGMVSYAVAQRTREVGIRMSLGANDGSVIRLLLGSGMKLVAVGGAIGMALAFVVARSLQSLLIGIDSFDAATFVVVPIVLGGVAAIAAYIPARRASGVNPITALKAE
jgi:predicted permease